MHRRHVVEWVSVMSRKVMWVLIECNLCGPLAVVRREDCETFTAEHVTTVTQ